MKTIEKLLELLRLDEKTAETCREEHPAMEQTEYESIYYALSFL